jgi:hypothetical protein
VGRAGEALAAEAVSSSGDLEHGAHAAVEDQDALASALELGRARDPTGGQGLRADSFAK